MSEPLVSKGQLFYLDKLKMLVAISEEINELLRSRDEDANVQVSAIAKDLKVGAFMVELNYDDKGNMKLSVTLRPGAVGVDIDNKEKMLNWIKSKTITRRPHDIISIHVFSDDATKMSSDDWRAIFDETSVVFYDWDGKHASFSFPAFSWLGSNAADLSDDG